jgi:hypothetical protein
LFPQSFKRSVRLAPSTETEKSGGRKESIETAKAANEKLAQLRF